jgi:catechol 2,3-dioxygenase-like lactoylglutathione lyase family enzyme
MTIEINGMAHVILTVSRFDVARDFYRKLLPRFGMKPVFGCGWRRRSDQPVYLG